MARAGVLGAIVIVALLLQATLLELIRFSVKPDLVLILVIFFALINGSRPGMILAAAAGLLIDLLWGRFLGINILTLTITAFLVGYLENKVFKDNLLVPILVVFCGSVLHAGLMLMFQELAGVHLPLSAGVRTGLLEAAYNALLAPLFYKLFYRSSTSGVLQGFKRGGL
ncbi:MAG: rod shape-determining protein MreD [Firmicutes bacterium]|nr:rod shape-determining protein MreD [Bacillota bacterium]